MKKCSIIFLLLVVSFSCSQEKISNKYAETITSKDLQNLLVTYSSDKFEDRQTGEYGEMLAVNFLRDFYIKNEIKPAKIVADKTSVFVRLSNRSIASPDALISFTAGLPSILSIIN